MSIDSVQDITPRVQYTSSASQTVFAYPFPIFENEDLVVIVDEILQALDTDYTVSGAGDDAGGNVTFLSGQTAGAIVTIYRDIAIQRLTDMQQNGPWTSASINDELDRLTLVDQQMESRIGRAVRTPIDDSVSDADMILPAAADRANKYPVFGSSGQLEVATSLPTGTLSSSAIGQALDSLVRTAAEIAAGVTPTNYAYPPGDVRRYGAALDGTTDDTTALTNWAAVAGHHTFPSGTAKITAAIPRSSNSTFTASRGAVIQTATTNISLFVIDTKTKVHVSGFRFVQTSAGNSGYVSAVSLIDSSHCVVEDNEMQGMQWSGVYMTGSDYCTVRNNYFHDFLTSAGGDKFGVNLYHGHNNVIEGNRFIGGSGHMDGGVLVQDPLGSGTDVPSRNKVRFNTVSGMKVYGIVVYLGGSDPTYNEVIGNHVEDIEGDPAIQAATGTGIYCVGIGLGGTKVCLNTVRNACTETTSTSNGPAGITVADVALNTAQPIVSDNTVEAMTQADGILIVSSPGGALVHGNVVIMPSSNDGSGPGGGSLAGAGIRVWNSNDTAVNANRVYHAGSGDGVFVYATTTNFERNSVVGNTVRVATGSPIRVDRTSTHTQTDLNISGNNIRSNGAGPAITIAGSDRGLVGDNSGTANTGVALAFSATTGIRVSGNRLHTNATNGVSTTGTCTGSNLDSSNSIAGNVSNGGTGFRIEQIGATPAAGTYVAGDTVWHTAPAAGASPGAICTTGGTPGTWKAMASIAA